MTDKLRDALESIAAWRTVNISGEYEHGLRDIIRSVTDCAAAALEAIPDPAQRSGCLDDITSILMSSADDSKRIEQILDYVSRWGSAASSTNLETPEPDSYRRIYDKVQRSKGR